MNIGKVGSKGELFPPKELRDILGLIPGEEIIFRVDYGRLIVEKYVKPDDVLDKPPKAHLTKEEFKKERRGLSEAISK